MSNFTESVVEEAALEWLEGLGYTVLHGPEIAVGEPGAERSDPGYRDVVLQTRLRKALERLNPGLPAEAIQDAYRRLMWAAEPSHVTRNHGFHQKLVEGVTVEFMRPDGSIGGALVHVIDFDHPDNNDWVAVNQFTVVEGQNNRRPDVLVACRSEFVTADPAGGVRVFPSDRPSIGGVCVDVASEFASQVGNRGEDAARDDVAFDLSEPDLDLVEP